MNCLDCPNQTDGKCCHQLIRPQGSKTMNVLDEAVWEREINHANRVQKQRKPKQIGIIGATGANRTMATHLAIAALAWHKTGANYEK